MAHACHVTTILAAALLLLSGCAGKDTLVCTPTCPHGFHCGDTGCVADGAAADMSVAGGDLASACTPACGGTTPWCNAAHQCVPCINDGHCPAGHVCKPAGATSACVPGCADDSRCAAGADGGAAGTAKCCGGKCVDTLNDPENCGTCNTACGVQNSSATCAGGVCKPGMCNAGWGNCNGDTKDGCEANLHIDPTNCTGCGMACAMTDAIAGCADGCYLAACKHGFADCNKDASDGCERNVSSDVNNCGDCGTKCGGAPHARATCANALCQLTSCDQGYTDCNGDPADGCEVATGADVKNCGACGNACAQGQVCTNGACTCPQCNIPNAKTKCVNNQCTFDVCLAGFADCNMNVADGCEVNLNFDVNNCTACGMKCPQAQTCSNGACKMISCMRIGWQMGNGNWNCPNGLRLPTVNEYNSVAPCITMQDQAMFGYYNDIGVSVGGCNCKWNQNWCGQPSIETIRGGRMCGDYAQLMICVN